MVRWGGLQKHGVVGTHKPGGRTPGNSPRGAETYAVGSTPCEPNCTSLALPSAAALLSLAPAAEGGSTAASLRSPPPTCAAELCCGCESSRHIPKRRSCSSRQMSVKNSSVGPSPCPFS